VNHTPGPWRVEFRQLPRERDFVILAGDDELAILYTNNGLDEPKWYPVEANARLIAAAPDLLAALQVALGIVLDARRMYHKYGAPCGYMAAPIRVIEAAIAKVEGREVTHG
jgi:hypothetical protein